MTVRRALAAWCLLFGCASAATLAAEQGDYSTLLPHKALATAPNDPTLRGVASGEASDEAASIAALARCTAALRGAAACEITRIDDAPVSSAAALRARVRSGPHPLFLWKFEAGASTVYLAGSIHVMKPTLFPLPAQ